LGSCITATGEGKVSSHWGIRPELFWVAAVGSEVGAVRIREAKMGRKDKK